MVLFRNQGNVGENGWQWDGEVKHTTNTSMIKKEIERLCQERTWIALHTPSYLSPPTIVFEVGRDKILVDRPKDWKAFPDVVISYKRKDGPWNFLKTQFIKEGSKELVLSVPYIWSVLERRDNLRVECPMDSFIVFSTKKGEIFKGNILNVSLTGALIEYRPSDSRKPPRARTFIDKIVLHLKSAEDGIFESVQASGGKIIRVKRYERLGKRGFTMGVELWFSPQQKKALMRYVRKRELELLKVIP